jgi:hypothetical protein
MYGMSLQKLTVAQMGSEIPDFILPDVHHQHNESPSLDSTLSHFKSVHTFRPYYYYYYYYHHHHRRRHHAEHHAIKAYWQWRYSSTHY